MSHAIGEFEQGVHEAAAIAAAGEQDRPVFIFRRREDQAFR